MSEFVMPTKSETTPNVSHATTTTYAINGFVATWQQGPIGSRGRSRSWENTSGFRQRVRRKRIRTTFADLPNNVYYDNTWNVAQQGSGGTVVFRPDSWYPADVNTQVGIHLNARLPARGLDDPLLQELMQKCIDKLPARMNGNQFNLPLFLIEAKKVVQMVAGAVRTISEILRKEGLRGRTVGNTWLEYRYGWRLLLKDVYDALTAVYDLCRKGIKQRVSVTSKHVKDRHLEFYAYEYAGNPNVGYSIGHNFFAEYEFGCTVTLHYVDDYPQLGTLQQFGVLNPAALIWETIPFSFVFDWFINVSAYLGSLNRFAGKTFVKGCVSTWVQGKCVTEHRYTQVDTRKYPRGAILSTALPPVVATQRLYKRLPLSTWPAADLPTIDIELSMFRIADSLALLRQASEVKPKRRPRRKPRLGAWTG